MSNSARKRKQKKEQQQSIFGGLRKVELIVIGVIALAVLMFVLKRCYRGNDNLPAPSNTSEAVENQQDSNRTRMNNTSATTIPRDRFGHTLYVVIDSLKFRTGPRLDSSLIRELKFGEQLTDMNEATNFEQTIRVSKDEVTTEPWIKVKDKSGKIGWVYGAGIRPYEKKRSQTTEEQEDE